MNEFYIYIFEVNAALFLFYLLYQVLFSRDTFLATRRMFLQTVVFLAFGYPLISLSAWLAEQPELPAMMFDYAEFVAIARPVTVIEKTAVALTWQDAVAVIWALGGAALCIRMLIQLTLVCRLAFRGKKIVWNGTKIIALEEETAPFSFFGWVFINPEHHTEKELQEIITHERAHVRQWHSLDMLLGELLCILFWFNPMVWLLRLEIRQNLEFLADKDVVRSGYDRKNYQYHLLRLSHQATAVQIVNNFNVSQLKKRIIMMNKKQSSRIGLIKYALLLPVTGLLILAGNAQAVAEIAEQVIMNQSTMVEVSDNAAVDENKMSMKGQVVDENGKPMPGVTVVIKDLNVGGMTDKEGKFLITGHDGGILCFSYVGKKTQVIPYAKDTKNFKVTMTTEAILLDQIVVTGYVSNGAAAKNETEENGEIFIVVEEMPRFAGEGIQKFLARNIKYPVIAQEKGIEGDVFVSFVVDKTGKVTQIKLVKGVDPSLDGEALRVVGMMPDWIPGKQRGKAVDVMFTIPIKFNLEKAGKETGMYKSQVLKGETVNAIQRHPDNAQVTGAGNLAVAVKAPAATQEVTVSRLQGNRKAFVDVDSYSIRRAEPADAKSMSIAFTQIDSMNKAADVMYIVDSKKKPKAFNINELQSDQIKRIDILKKNAATAIYGESGKNGVIIIYTK